MTTRSARIRSVRRYSVRRWHAQLGAALIVATSVVTLALGLSSTSAYADSSRTSSASIKSGGSLTFSPGKGTDVASIWLVSSAPCPASAESVSATVVGRGFPAPGEIVVANSSADISRTNRMIVPLQDTFEGFAATRGIKLTGPYQITLRCIDRVNTKVFAAFSGTVTFKNPHAYVAPAATLVKLPTDSGPPVPGPSAGATPGSTGPTGSGASGADDGTTAGGAGGQQTTGGSATDPSANTATAPLRPNSSGLSPIQLTALLVGMGLLGWGGYTLFRHQYRSDSHARHGNGSA